MGVAAPPWTSSDLYIRPIMDSTAQVLPHEPAGQGIGTGMAGGQAGQDLYHLLASAVGMVEVTAPCLGLYLAIEVWPLCHSLLSS